MMDTGDDFISPEDFWIIGDETKAVPASDVVGVIPPVNGARNELTLQWLHSHFGTNISSLEYRRFRAFLNGYSAFEYMQGVRQGITIQQAKQDGTDLMYEDNKLYMESYERREQRGLAFEVKAEELVKWIRKVVFLVDPQNSSGDEGVVVNENERGQLGAVGEETGAAAVVDMDGLMGDPDEFSSEWFHRVFRPTRTEINEEHAYVDRAMMLGIRAANYAGALRGIEIEKRSKRGEEPKGTDLDFVRGRLLWREGHDEDYVAAEVEKARENDTKAFLED